MSHIFSSLFLLPCTVNQVAVYSGREWISFLHSQAVSFAANYILLWTKWRKYYSLIVLFPSCVCGLQGRRGHSAAPVGPQAAGWGLWCLGANSPAWTSCTGCDRSPQCQGWSGKQQKDKSESDCGKFGLLTFLPFTLSAEPYTLSE